MATRNHAVQLDPEAYGLLEAEACRRRVGPDELVGDLVRAELAPQERNEMEAALAGLADFRASLPDVDGLALAREARDELERRGV